MCGHSLRTKVGTVQVLNFGLFRSLFPATYGVLLNLLLAILLIATYLVLAQLALLYDLATNLGG